MTVPPFLACGAPIRSSILLAPLIPVAGLDGGAEGGPEGGPIIDSVDVAFGSCDAVSPFEGACTAGDALRDG